MKHYYNTLIELLKEDNETLEVGGEDDGIPEPTSKVENILSVFDSVKPGPTVSRKKYYVKVISQDTNRLKEKNNKKAIKNINAKHLQYLKALEAKEKERLASSLKTFFSFQHLYSLPSEYKKSAQIIETFFDTF